MYWYYTNVRYLLQHLRGTDVRLWPTAEMMAAGRGVRLLGSCGLPLVLATRNRVPARPRQLSEQIPSRSSQSSMTLIDPNSYERDRRTRPARRSEWYNRSARFDMRLRRSPCHSVGLCVSPAIPFRHRGEGHHRSCRYGETGTEESRRQAPGQALL